MATPPSAARKTLINTTIKALKSASIWDQLDVLYFLAAADIQAALLNWKTPGTFTAIAVNMVTLTDFVADRGFTGDGSTSRLRTQYTPSTNAVNLTQDNMSAWVWCTTNIAEAGRDIGGNNGTGRIGVTARSSGGTLIVVQANDATTSSSTATISTSVGLTGTTRATSGVKKGWRNGVQLGADLAVASVAMNANEQWICGSNNNSFSTKQIAFAAWGAALTGKELAFYNIVNAYMQQLGAA